MGVEKFRETWLLKDGAREETGRLLIITVQHRQLLYISSVKSCTRTSQQLRTVPTFVNAHTFCAHASISLSARALGLTLTQSTTPSSTRLKLKKNFPTATKSSLMSLYLNKEHQKGSI